MSGAAQAEPDAVSPELAWVEGRCYRLNEPLSAALAALQEHDLYAEEIMYDPVEDDGGDEDFEVTRLENGRYCTEFHVAQHYLGAVIGKKAVIKRRIESDTRCEIRIPRAGQEGGIVILGQSESNVKAARRRINIVVLASRIKQRPTHFISIRMFSSSIVDNYNKFKEDILSEGRDRGIEESIFTKPERLHLTLGVMCLMDNQERLLASKLLADARDNIVLPALNSQPLHIRMKGVAYFNDDPHEVDVLYAKVEETDRSGRLQKLADDVVEHFARGGFPQRGWPDSGGNKVKLHMTLLNSVHRKDANEDVDDDAGGEGGGRRKWVPRVTFDASRILDKYKDYEFGEQTLKDIHLSQLHTTGPDGYYISTCVISCLRD